MKNNITKSLSAIGYSNYILTIDGRLYKQKPSPKEIKKDNINRFYIIDDCGRGKKATLKHLYKQIFGKEFATDNITDLKNEEWKQIANTNGRYYISNCGRVKSVCRYSAKIL